MQYVIRSLSLHYYFSLSASLPLSFSHLGDSIFLFNLRPETTMYCWFLALLLVLRWTLPDSQHKSKHSTLTQLSHLLVSPQRTVTCEHGDLWHLTLLSVILDRLKWHVPHAWGMVVVVVLQSPTCVVWTKFNCNAYGHLAYPSLPFISRCLCPGPQ